MNIIITTRNTKASDYLKDTIEKKLQKLSKYFSDDIGINVMLSEEAGRKKIEATIHANGMIFRAEDKADEFYDGIDNIVKKLSSQMTKFKKKIQRKHKDNKEFNFDAWPEAEGDGDFNVIRTKKFELEPMTVDEAVLQMEMLEHNFFVFLNMETDSVNVVYSRKDGDYGLLETTY